ncbi:hypothetical protein A1O3_06758 [Capronia epimyces CBS 606.96]|uniref:NmrA-like domain-containing protein n=1 Tax=Capronia epimyces CBS 606.96 TaxID=1182542 RepID=W9Y137_9EURO|nr:uncharacterized protein A1O3_06758 [Capronia epimyces CBS 606.96]EXJ82941.1 hypothetical protein A1O3_06758 [Capronia epimyces CBS 606.96]
MAKTIVITGATGTQGGSVVAAFLRDPSFNVRALTRDTESPAAQALREKGADVVAGDLMNEASLVAAFKARLILGLEDASTNGPH